MINKVVLAGFLLVSMGAAQDKSSVTQGTDGWLFFNEELTPVQDFDRLPQNYRDLEAIKKLLDARGIRLHIVLVPRKAWIYQSKLSPAALAALKKADTYDAVLEKLHGLKLSVTDLRPAFTQAISQGQQLYFRTDTHWNPQGAALAGKLVSQDLKLPSNADLPAATYQVTQTPGTLTGDLTRFLGGASPEPYTALEFNRSDSLGLLDESVPGITLVGTSYSASGVLAKSLAVALGKDVLDASAAAIGYINPLTRYLSSNNFQLHPPKVIVWEIPDRLIARDFFTSDATDTLQLGADLAAQTSCLPLKTRVPLTNPALSALKLKWNEFLRVIVPADAGSVTVSHGQAMTGQQIDTTNGAVINLPSLGLAPISFTTSKPVTVDLFRCPLPAMTVQRLITGWKTLNIAQQLVLPTAYVSGLYEAVEPGGKRSGYGPKTTVNFWTTQTQKVHLDIQTENYIPKQSLTVLLNGKLVKTLNYQDASATPGGFTLDTLSQAGLNTLEIHYADWNGKTKKYFPQDSRPVGILFTRFQISR